MRCQRAVNQPAKISDNYLREVFKFYDNERLSQISEIVDLHNYCIGSLPQSTMTRHAQTDLFGLSI